MVLSLILGLCSLALSGDCPPRVRVSWHTITADQKQLYFDAVKALKASGVYDKFARIHWEKTNADWAHGKYGFFPWHREFLWEFENAIRALGGKYACYNVPFWDWERDAGREQTSVVVADFGGMNSGCIKSGPFAGWTDFNKDCVQRKFDKTIFFVGEARTVDIITSSTSYGTTSGFRANIEGAPHASVHNFFGGHMGSMMSASDPIFFIVHANVDRLWYLWSDCQGFINKRVTRAKFPTDTTEVMPFNWKFSRSNLFPEKEIGELLDINNNPLPYTFAVDDHLARLANTLLPGKCKWTHFTKADTNVAKRSIESAQKSHHRFPDTKYGFSDPRVDAAYEKICQYYKKARQDEVYVEDYENPEFKDTVIEECHICTKKGSYRHATPEWIVMNGMTESKHVFKPICIEVEEYEETQQAKEDAAGGDYEAPQEEEYEAPQEVEYEAPQEEEYEQPKAPKYQAKKEYEQPKAPKYQAKKEYEQPKAPKYQKKDKHHKHEDDYEYIVNNRKFDEHVLQSLFDIEDDDEDYDSYQRYHHNHKHEDDYGYGYEHEDDYGYGDDDYGYGYDHEDDYGYGYEHEDDYGYGDEDDYGYGHEDYGYGDDDYGYEHDDYGYGHAHRY
uniref:Tyrosinase copper-binding domain-containing protein n=1 Tax=Arcella intermedia TaxID=1963864 RepID=A0A6B2KZX3_9EUKA